MCECLRPLEEMNERDDLFVIIVPDAPTPIPSVCHRASSVTLHLILLSSTSNTSDVVRRIEGRKPPDRHC